MGVNEYFLMRGVEEIREKATKLIDGEEELLLGKLKYEGKFGKSSDLKRNFFAHSGFLLEYTIFGVKNGKVYVKWVENAKRTIKSWLLNPEK